MSRGLRLALFVVACAHLAFACARYADSLIDDAYIVFRYADHLVAGFGPVFNPGERVEGFTSPLWLLLVAALRALGFRGEPIVTTLGVTFAIVAVGAAWRLGWRLAPGWLALLPPLLLATHPAHAMWSVHGLETPLFVALVTSALASWADGSDAGARRAGILLGLAFWTRPEGALAAAVPCGLALLRGERTRALRLAGPFLLFALPLLAARFAFFGALVPNTFHAKSGGGLGRVAFGMGYARLFVTTHAPLVAACAASAIAAALGAFRGRGAASWKQGRGSAALDLAALGAAWSLYVVWIGGDAFPGYRFWLPILPAAAALAAWGGRCLLPPEGLGAAKGRRAGVGAALLACGAAVVAFVSIASRPDVDREYETGMEFTERMKAVGLWLGANAPPGTTIALNYVGAVPYLSKLPAIDMLGLTDPAVARTPIVGRFRFPGHARGNGASILDREPGLILMGGVHLSREKVVRIGPELDSEDQIAADPRFAAAYELVQAPIDGPGGPSWFAFYKRKDLAWRPAGS